MARGRRRRPSGAPAVAVATTAVAATAVVESRADRVRWQPLRVGMVGTLLFVWISWAWVAGPASAKEFDVSALLGELEKGERESLLLGQQALDDWRRVFEGRTLADWGRLWTVEKHRRCYSDLRDHMDWVCRSGLSAIKRASNNRGGGTGRGGRGSVEKGRGPTDGTLRRLRHLPLAFLFALRKVDDLELQDPGGVEENDSLISTTDDDITKETLGSYGQPTMQALQMLRRSGAVDRGKRKERGIMDECCHQNDGCSWEEYAEYCHVGNRDRRFAPP